jgi:hypothetical protein
MRSLHQTDTKHRQLASVVVWRLNLRPAPALCRLDGRGAGSCWQHPHAYTLSMEVARRLWCAFACAGTNQDGVGGWPPH